MVGNLEDPSPPGRPGDREVLDAVMAEFLAELDLDAARLTRALASADFATAARSAHKIRGAADMIGAQPLAAVAGLVEFLARYGDLHGTDIANRALNGAIHTLESFVLARAGVPQGSLS